MARSLTLLGTALLFGGIFALRVADPTVGDGETLLYVIPVGLLAVSFGLRGGVAGAAVALTLTVTWDLSSPGVAISAVGLFNRGLALVAVGVLVGTFVDHRRRLDAELARYFEQSLDLLWSADMAGRLIRVNPAWERALGRTASQVRHRPLTDFMHPRDRDAAAAELLALAGGSHERSGLRSRYETAEGRHVWLEWSVRAAPGDGVIYGVAHDITPQRRAERQLAGEARQLQGMVAERTRDLDEARAETLQLLAVAGEYRDDETSQHTERVGALSAEIGQRLGLSEQSVRLLREAAPLHDIGKLAIPDRVLLKPGRLTRDEQELMHTHTTLGARLLFGSRSPALQLAGLIAESHHEWWNGSGYPRGLVGANTPLVGRIVAVADVFDALTHDRPYKAAWPLEQALAMIRSSAGTQFDPQVVKAFLALAGALGADTAPPVAPTGNGFTKDARPVHRVIRRPAGEPPALPRSG